MTGSTNDESNSFILALVDEIPMGSLKDTLLDAETFTSHPDRFVSAECFEDPFLQRLITANLVSRVCTYSGRRARKPIAAPLDLVVTHILSSLECHYDDAANGVAWEGGYVGDMTLDTYDLVDETVTFADDASDTLRFDIVNALPQRDWSKIDPYGPRERDVLSWSWNDFTETVKHVRRYFFERHLTSTDWREETVSPSQLLSEVLSNCEATGMIRALPAGQRYFRCRSRKKGERYIHPIDLGPPPAVKASQSRMSPAGIPMFYGARERKTARAEILEAGQRYAIAEFRTTRPIRILDLTMSPRVSIFDPHNGHLNEWAHFMGAFVRDFQRPVAHDGAEHVDYVPTQVVSEYIRSWPRKGGQIDGVAYRSVKRPGGQCVVLFIDASEVEPAIDPREAPAGTKMLAMRVVTNRGKYAGERGA
ncbi:HEPN-associated N-terminal domain-containing protein [Sphingomonas sp. KR3-1]|uniref:HEPN-associated N-terminal domain-containing protein n=1 Tax=Sphingomonas sp. KR3-1 TaxID=3156611 RepID=UPI0032B524AB